MRKEKIVENNIHEFIFELSGYASALSLIWEFSGGELTEKRISAATQLIDEIYNRITTLENFMSDSGDLTNTFSRYKNKLDLYKMLTEKTKESK
ncbi:TPA: hypothetical protein ACY3HI_002816 [Citrobacter braakii]